MSGFSAVYTKKQFLKLMKDSIADDELVIISTFVNNMSCTRKSKKITTEFPIKGFSNGVGVKDLLQSKLSSFIIGDKSIITNELYEQVKAADKKKKIDKS